MQIYKKQVNTKNLNSKSKADFESELANAKKIQKKQLVFFAILLLLILSGCVAYIFRSQENKSIADCKECQVYLKSELFKFPFLDPSRNFLEKKDVITNIDPLRQALRDLVKKEEGFAKISLYFEVLNTGANISINQEEKLFPVSLAKVPLSMLVMKKIENGELDIDQELEITDENLNWSSGDLSKQIKANSRIQIVRLLREMLINSDNTAYRVLKRNTALEDRKKLAEDIGLGELFDDRGRVSAKEYSRLLRTLYTASYLNQEHSEMILKMLSENNFKNYLSVGVPQDVIFSHKHGQNLTLNIYSDSGIVYFPNRPYIISVMIEPLNSKGYEGEVYAQNLFRQISEQTYSYIKNK